MNIKKIEYLTQDLISPYIRETYPLFAKLIKSFSKYLDQNNYGKILFIDDNLDPYNAFDELLNLMLNEFFSQTFDFDVYDLTDDNKRRFIDLAEKINGLKGNKQSFAVFFQTFVNFSFATGSGIVSFPTLGTISLTEPTAPEDIYKYALEVDAGDIQGFESLIENIHPAGIKYFLITNLVDQDQNNWASSVFAVYNNPSPGDWFVALNSYVFFFTDVSSGYTGKKYELTVDIEVVTGPGGELQIYDGVTTTTLNIPSTGSYIINKTFSLSATENTVQFEGGVPSTVVRFTNVVYKEII